MVKVSGAFQKSTEIMKTTNQLIKLPQLSATMREMSMEMMKVGQKGQSLPSGHAEGRVTRWLPGRFMRIADGSLGFSRR